MGETRQDTGRQTFLSSSSLILSLWLPQETDISWSLYHSSFVYLRLCCRSNWLCEQLPSGAKRHTMPGSELARLRSCPSTAITDTLFCSPVTTFFRYSHLKRNRASQTEFTLWRRRWVPPCPIELWVEDVVGSSPTLCWGFSKRELEGLSSKLD